MSFFLPFTPDKETSQEVESLGNQLVMCIVGAMSSATSPHRSVVCVWGVVMCLGGVYSMFVFLCMVYVLIVHVGCLCGVCLCL